MNIRLTYRSLPFLVIAVLLTSSQLIAQATPATTQEEQDHRAEQREQWYRRGRYIPGESTAALRAKAHAAKLRLRALQQAGIRTQSLTSGNGWVPLGPAPLASDASGFGQQDYGWVSGRATTIAVDPADATGNTVYIGGANGGVWKSVNAGSLSQSASSVLWTPISDTRETLAIGSIAIQPGNNNPANSVILVGTGETNSSLDSYYGLGILRSADAGKSWTLIPSDSTGIRSFAGFGFSKIAFSSINPSLVVAATAGAAKGGLEGLENPPTVNLGLYYSTNGGNSWSYASIKDGITTIPPGSATSVIFNAAAGMFYATLRYHGIYSSSDGINWSRLATQPGPGLGLAACPTIPTLSSCPIYRGEFAIVPGRNEMYAWYVDINDNDQGIWRSINGGASWTAISEAGIPDCGDPQGCGTLQATYNLELAAAPNGANSTDLYAGAVNLYKCTLANTNATSCLQPSWLNLTHVYGCAPNFGSIAHVHPDQHDVDFAVANGKSTLYFANDGGIYRALDGYTGLTTGTCGLSNQFDSLNQTLGSMTQFVSFSQSPSDLNMLLGGAQGNGSPATASAQTSSSWMNVNSGDSGFNEINPVNPNEWFTSNTDVSIQRCALGAACHQQDFANGLVVSNATLAGDSGAFYTPYILDPQNSGELLVGTCRVWRGSSSGSGFSALSYNFDTGTGATCSGNESNLVRSLAAGGTKDVNGLSNVVYAGTDMQLFPGAPAGGHIWVTTNASAAPTAWIDRTGATNPLHFPVSGVAIDTSDPTGNTAYIAVMGFHVSHVWKTSNAGQTWTDFTANLPDSPANALLADSVARVLYVGTDVGVFSTSTTSPSWTELGPAPNSGQAGYLPNVSVTALRIYSSGGIKRLRASTYGRGIWEINLIVTPDYFFTVPTPTLTAFPTQNATFSGTLTAVNGFNALVTLSCTGAKPTNCTPTPASPQPTPTGTTFTVAAGSAVGDYFFNIHAVGWDTNVTTHDTGVTLHVVDFGLTSPSPASITVQHGTTSAPINFQVNASGSFQGTVTLSCSGLPAGASCAFNPPTATPTSGSPVSVTLTVAVPYTAPVGTTTVFISATTSGAPASKTQPLTLTVTTNPDFVMTEPTQFPVIKAGTKASGPINITAQDGFSGTIALTCSFAGGSLCTVLPTTVNKFPATATVTMDATTLGTGNAYSMSLTGISGAFNHALAIPFTVSDYKVTATTPASVAQGQTATSTITLSPMNSYAGSVTLACDASPLPGASCTLAPSGALTVGPNEAQVTASIVVPATAASGIYNIKINTQDTAGVPQHAAVIPVTVTPDFQITSSTGPQTILAGQSATYTLNIDPTGTSFDMPVALTCSGAPDPSSCSFNPTIVTPGTGSTSVLTMITIGPVGSSSNRATSLSAMWLMLPGLTGLCGILARKSRRKHILLLAVLCCGMVELSCGGGGGGGSTSPAPGGGSGTNGTPKGTYTLTATATSGSLTHTTQVVLTVQ
jgi:hypothetical protein